MILQRDERLLPAIQKYGCYFMSLLYFANKFTNCKLWGSAINQLYYEFVERGWMSENCYVYYPAKILNHFGVDCEFIPHHFEPDRDCAEDEFEILCFGLNGDEHFVAGDGKGNVAYDPWGVSKTVKFGILKSKRIYRRKIEKEAA